MNIEIALKVAFIVWSVLSIFFIGYASLTIFAIFSLPIILSGELIIVVISGSIGIAVGAIIGNN